jgi:hypothetical protein
VKSNISMLDRYVRLTSGLVLLGCAMGMRRRSVIARSALLGFGAMKVAEGATGWCPLAHLAESLSSKSNGENQQQSSAQQSNAQRSGAQQSGAEQSSSQYSGSRDFGSGHSNGQRSGSEHSSSQHSGSQHSGSHRSDSNGRNSEPYMETESNNQQEGRSFQSYNAHRQRTDSSHQEPQVH